MVKRVAISTGSGAVVVTLSGPRLHPSDVASLVVHERGLSPPMF